MTVHAIALTGLSNTAKSFRNELSAFMGGATTARPTGTRSGVRYGTPTNTVSLSGLTGTVKPHAGIMDVQASATAGPYVYAVTADETFAVTPAHATYARIDIVTIRINDTVEDGSGLETAQVVYTEGIAAATPLQPAPTTTRELLIATIASPVSGGGSPVVSWVAPYEVAAGGILPVRNATERAALATAYPPSTHAPLFVWQIDVARALSSTDGTNWKTLDGKFYWTNAAARTAATGMAEGDLGYQVDTKTTYVCKASTWVIFNTGSINWGTVPGGITVGNGTLAQSYGVASGIVRVVGYFALGSTSAITGDIILQHPIESLDGYLAPLGSAVIVDAGTSMLHASIRGDSTMSCVITPHVVGGSSVFLGGISATVPFTWTAGDAISWSYSYRAA